MADARDSEVLTLFAEIVTKLGTALVPQIPKIFENVFQCTLEMITKNFEGACVCCCGGCAVC